MNSSELRVFISSTFRDLQEEREYLVKKIFPEIRALCRARGVTFTEVDLRWGLTDEDVALGRIIRTCLEEIDRCRPYFIGITGERYGYVPELHEIYRDPDLLARYPWIEDAMMEEASIIDMEVRHGALNRKLEANDEWSRFFFRRERRSLEEENDAGEERGRLEDLKQRIRDAGLPVEEFRDPVSLGEMVYDELVAIIKRDFADVKVLTPLEAERSRHRAFAASRTGAYIPNATYLKRLNDHAAGDNPPLVIYAESGSGKSSLVAYWAEHYRRKNPGAHVVEHYVGIGASDTDHLGVMRHLMSEIKESFGRSEEIPTDPEELARAFANWLGYARDEDRPSPLIIIIDGLNQLQGNALSLSWLPATIPSNIRLVVTSTVEETLVHLRERGWGELGMQLLSEQEREAVVVRFLGQYHKALSIEQIRRVALDQKSSHPLFLRTILEELRLHGTHEHLDEQLDYYLETTGTEDVFQRVLERLESDFGTREVREVMSLLFIARFGLSEMELADITGFSRLKLSALVLGLDFHLVKRDGTLGFFHDYLRRAVEKRYLADKTKRRAINLRLAGYFEKGLRPLLNTTGLENIEVRGPRELAWQLHEAQETKRLADVLSEIPWFMTFYTGETIYEVLGYWAELRESIDMELSYKESLERWRGSRNDESEDLHVLKRVADLFEATTNWEGAIDLQRERLIVSQKVGDHSVEADVRSRLGWLHQMRGEYVMALEEFNRSCALYEETNNRRGLATVIGNMGIVYSSTGEFDRSMECYREQESICRDVDDRQGLSTVVGHIGVLLYQRGEHDRALECYEEQESICREFGDRHGIALAIGHRGLIYTQREEFDRALECYLQQEAICRELGNRFGISRAVGNIGIVHHERGEIDRALDCYQEMRDICRDIGNRHGLALAIGNIGVVYRDRGEHDRALECYREQLSICRELGDKGGLAQCIGNMGVLYENIGNIQHAIISLSQAIEDHRAISYKSSLIWWLQKLANILLDIASLNTSMPEYLPEYIPDSVGEDWRRGVVRRARTYIEESIANSEELSMHSTQFNGRVMLARVDALEGDVDSALEHLHGMLLGAHSDVQRAELWYRMWNIDKTFATDELDVGNARREEHRLEALKLYTVLFQETSRYEYRLRIDKLTL